jgi:NAD(P)-dependent dehydrogenase (short-subunit alcohol dehydrogenase family)
MADEGFLAVTGATGGVGGRVARRLADAGVRQRLVVRDPSRAPALPGATVARATYDEPAAMRDAFAGADAVFLVSAAEHPERVRQHLAAVDAIADAGSAGSSTPRSWEPPRTRPSPWPVITGRPRSTCAHAGWRSPSCVTRSISTSSR